MRGVPSSFNYVPQPARSRSAAARLIAWTWRPARFLVPRLVLPLTSITILLQPCAAKRIDVGANRSHRVPIHISLFSLTRYLSLYMRVSAARPVHLLKQIAQSEHAIVYNYVMIIPPQRIPIFLSLAFFRSSYTPPHIPLNWNLFLSFGIHSRIASIQHGGCLLYHPRAE